MMRFTRLGFTGIAGLLIIPCFTYAAPPATGRHQRRRRDRGAELEYQQRAFPLGAIPRGALARGLAQTRQAEAGQILPLYGTVYMWHQLGPAPIQTAAGELFSGRVTALAVDPASPGHWLIGAAQGGIWETPDYGANWAPRTDEQASLAMGAITFAPGSPTLVYAGTGEPNFSGDSYRGQGLLVSHDSGASWQLRNSTFAESSIGHIQVDAYNSNLLSVATVRGVAGIVAHGTDIPPLAPPRGVFVSTDGGTNFTRVLTGEATALAAQPDNFRNQYAGLGEILGSPVNGVYRTTNGWNNHELVQGPWTAMVDPTNIGRIAIAISAGSSSVAYVGVAYRRDSTLGDLVGIWRTDNAWTSPLTWTQLPNTSAGPYTWYSFDLLVDNNDPFTLYLAGYDVQRFQAGAWSTLATDHPDQHVLAWVPWAGLGDNWRLLLGNDGGAFLSTSYPPAGSWNNLNAGLAISQMYKGAVTPAPPAGGLALAGMQDNGTAANTNSLVWQSVFGGDGCDCAIANSDPQNHWAYSWETYYNTINILRSLDGGANPENAGFGILCDDNTPFFVHFEKAPHNDDLFIAGTVQLWRCTNFFSGASAEWTSNSPPLFDSAGAPVTVTAMAFAPSDPNGLVYAFGTEDGQLRVTSDGGGHWSDLDGANGVPDRYVTGLAFSPTDSNVLYVTLSGFDEGTPGQPGHLFRSANALSASPAWANVSPPVDLPMNCLAIDPANPNLLFVGADIGVWTTSTAGGAWTHLGPGLGMPNVAVFDLRLNSIGQVTAFTHGRGAFDYVPTIPGIVVAGPVYPIDIACLTCPPEKWINPGDLVTMALPLQNVLPGDALDLTATLLASPSIVPLTGSQDYGTLHGQGAPVSRTFSFQANLTSGPGLDPAVTCGSTVEATFQLTDGTNNLGQVSVPFRLGTPSHPLAEEFEETAPPLLPRDWLSTATGVDPPWMTTTNIPPNVLPAGSPDDVGDVLAPPVGPPNHIVFTPTPLGIGQNALTTAPFFVATPLAQLYFRQAFSVSNTYDGGVLEIALGAQPFQELTLAGGSFAQAGYNAVLNDRNPLGPRPAWSGDSGGWLPVLANLPAAAAGQTVQLRWHFGSARGFPAGGWFVDSVAVTEPLCLPAVSNPVILNPVVNGNLFSFSIATVTNRTYVIEYKTNLNDAAWQVLESLNGNGLSQSITVPTAGGQAYYRFEVP